MLSWVPSFSDMLLHQAVSFNLMNITTINWKVHTTHVAECRGFSLVVTSHGILVRPLSLILIIHMPFSMVSNKYYYSHSHGYHHYPECQTQMYQHQTLSHWSDNATKINSNWLAPTRYKEHDLTNFANIKTGLTAR